MAFITGISNLSWRPHHTLQPRRRRQCACQRVLAKADADDSTDDFASGMAAASGPSRASIPQESITASVPPPIAPLAVPDVDEADDDLRDGDFVDDDHDVESGLQGFESSAVVQDTDEGESCLGEIVWSPSLQEYREQMEAGLVSSAIGEDSEWDEEWALAVSVRKGQELRNQYSRVGILMARNFSDFEPSEGCLEEFRTASLEELSLTKARAVYETTGMPAIAESNELTIDAPESGSRINKTLQHGYFTRNVPQDADAMIDRVRPISDENRMTRFRSAVAYCDGENEIVEKQTVNVAIAFSSQSCVTIATTGALDELYKELTRRFGLKLDSPRRGKKKSDNKDEGEKGKVLIGATLLKERILREGKMLNDSIIKVSSFMNHMVDTELMEVCGEELAERLRRTMPSKVLTVESTGLIVGLPTARKLGIPLVFARKTRPITISDSYQTTYRSATKGTTSELIVSCEYLEEGDRVLIIDDFLAGGSTAEALFKLARMAHAKVVGVGVLIEKMSDGGRTFLSGYDVPVESLAKIMPGDEKGQISFVEEEEWESPQEEEKKRRKAKEEAAKSESEFLSMAAVAAEIDEDGEADGVDVISWEDEDVLDDIEEHLVREVGRG